MLRPPGARSVKAHRALGEGLWAFTSFPSATQLLELHPQAVIESAVPRTCKAGKSLRPEQRNVNFRVIEHHLALRNRGFPPKTYNPDADAVNMRGRQHGRER